MTELLEAWKGALPKRKFRMELKPIGYQDVAECPDCYALARMEVYPEHAMSHAYQLMLTLLAMGELPDTEGFTNAEMIKMLSEVHKENIELLRAAMREAGYQL